MTKAARLTELMETGREELSYWQQERKRARELGDAERMAQCEEFLKQCEGAMATLDLIESRGRSQV